MQEITAWTTAALAFVTSLVITFRQVRSGWRRAAKELEKLPVEGGLKAETREGQIAEAIARATAVRVARETNALLSAHSRTIIDALGGGMAGEENSGLTSLADVSIADHPMRILHGEDDSTSASTFARALASFKAVSIDVCSSGDELLAALYDGAPDSRYDLLVLDINMPRLNGHRVLRELRENPVPYSLPVVVLSSSIITDDVEAAYAAGAHIYLRKPAMLSEYRAFVVPLYCLFSSPAMIKAPPARSRILRRGVKR